MRVEGKLPGAKGMGGGSVRIRVRVMFEYVYFLHFDFRGINIKD